jgi:PAS domain-containing protein
MKGNPADIDKLKAHYDRALAGESHNFKEDYGEESSRSFFDVSYNPIYDNDQKVIGLSVFAQDITERRQVDEALQQSENKLLEAQRIANLGHYVLDIKTGMWTSSPELNTIFGISDSYEKDVANSSNTKNLTKNTK